MTGMIRGLFVLAGLTFLGAPAEAQVKYVRQPGSRNVSTVLRAVPAVATDLTTIDTWLFQITVANTTGGALTFTVIDKQTSPVTLLAAVSIAANTTYIIRWPEPVFMSGGVNWSASGAGLTADVVATTR